jgi:hypothetical protein
VRTFFYKIRQLSFKEIALAFDETEEFSVPIEINNYGCLMEQST